MHPSQWMRLQWEEYQQDKRRRGETISDAFREDTEREIAVAEAKIFTRSPITPRSARSVWFNPPTRRPSGQVVPNYKIGSDKRTIKPRALEFIDPAKLRRAGLKTPEISAIEAVHLAHEAAAITEHEKAIIHKINHSLKYPQAHVNFWLLGKQRDILEKDLLSPEKFDGIKGLIYKSWNFYRDPRAMRALFEREAPFCMGCTGRGDILDCRFNKIAPTTSEAELLKLEDFCDWGLFLVFACRCAAEQGYWYRKHTPLELEGLMDEDEKYAQALVRYLG
ncbi:hypothetical protein TI39_contig322g00022 [Zymoseptoria brevis]|uniref:Uncharacterized protein n=1 Tax=Zymoseptoria brevis TaxID=1047168 RepID=A0A0F4GWK5_9PEZI|nr:hypothetical protein TI39_contig322g00022 [Zymoseptoria brevis]